MDDINTLNVIHSLDQLDPNKKSTYADYLTWEFDEMVELTKGKIFKKTPATKRRHLEISWNFYLFLQIPESSDL